MEARARVDPHRGSVRNEGEARHLHLFDLHVRPEMMTPTAFRHKGQDSRQHLLPEPAIPELSREHRRHTGDGGSLGFCDPDADMGFGYTPNQTIATMVGGDRVGQASSTPCTTR
jgi:hypothetical protein